MRGSRTFHPLRVAEVEELTDDAVAVTFEVPDSLAEEFVFVPGQNLTLRRVVDGVEERRQYSISSAAGARPRVGVREIPDGEFSRWLVREVRAGDEIEVLPPGGRFCPDPAYLEGGHHLCIAAGSGITPMLSVAASVLANDGDVTLLYGNRTTGSVMFAEELADLKNRYGPQLQLVHVLSREPRDVDLFSGRLDADRLRRLLTTLVAGRPLRPRLALRPARDAARRAGRARRARRAEGAGALRAVLRRRAAARAAPRGRRGRGRDQRGHRRPRRSHHDLADAQGRRRSSTAPARTRNDLPFACKGGVCGTCRALVRDGEVDMRRNYALDEDEVERGFVLTCQTHPVSDAVTVDYDA